MKAFARTTMRKFVSWEYGNKFKIFDEENFLRVPSSHFSDTTENLMKGCYKKRKQNQTSIDKIVMQSSITRNTDSTILHFDI